MKEDIAAKKENPFWGRGRVSDKASQVFFFLLVSLMLVILGYLSWQSCLVRKFF